MAAKVCLLSSEETFQYETYNVIPDCASHRHCSKLEADSMSSHNDIEHRVTRKLKSTDGRRRMMCESGRSWQKVTPRSHNEKLGYAGMQMVSGRAGYIPSPARKQSFARGSKGRVLVENGRPIEATA